MTLPSELIKTVSPLPPLEMTNAINAWLAPWLTSIRIPYESFGGHVVAQLQSLWSGEPTAEVRVPHELPRSGLARVTA